MRHSYGIRLGAMVLGSVSVLTVAALAACGSFSGTNDGASNEGDASGESDGNAASDGPPSTPDAIAMCTIPTDSDPMNCGACAHSCLGGACVNGKCQPTRITTSSDPNVMDLVVDQSFVIWSTSPGNGFGNGSVYSALKVGAPAMVGTIYDAPTPMGGLASDGTTAYFATLNANGGLFRVDNGQSTSVPNSGTASQAYFLCSRSDALYLDVYGGEADASYPRTIYRFANGFSTVGSPYPNPGQGGSNSTQIAVTQNRVYIGLTSEPGIWSMDLKAPAGWVLFDADATEYVQSMTATDDRLVFVDINGNVRGCADGPTCNGLGTLLTTSDLHGKAITVHFTHGELLVETDGGDIFACDVTSCAMSNRLVVHDDGLALMNTFGRGRTVAEDETAIYWAAIDGSNEGGVFGGTDSGLVTRIMRIAK